MATIHTRIEGSLLIVSVSGVLTAEEVASVIAQYYSNGIVKDVIWDIAIGSLSFISNDGFREIAGVANKALESGARQGGKTAYIGSAEQEYGVLKMYTAIAELTGVPTQYNVFGTIKEARNWIDQNFEC